MANSTLVITDEAGDCWADVFNNFDNSTSPLYVGDTFAAADRDPRVWIPFTVPLSRGITVVSATLTLYGAQTSSSVTSTIKLSCEASDNVSDPTSGADCRARTRTTATSNVTLNQYILNTAINYDVTTMVREVLNQSGWVKGNRLAVMIDDVDTVDKPHRAYSYENGSNRPTLTIVVTPQIPRMVEIT